MSKNDKGHHMTSGQRAMIAAMVRDMRNRKALLSYMAKHPDLSEAEAKQALANAAKTKKSLRKDDDNSVVIISDRDTAEQTSVSRELIRKAALVIEYERELVEHVEIAVAQWQQRALLRTQGQAIAADVTRETLSADLGEINLDQVISAIRAAIAISD